MAYELKEDDIKLKEIRYLRLDGLAFNFPVYVFNIDGDLTNGEDIVYSGTLEITLGSEQTPYYAPVLTDSTWGVQEQGVFHKGTIHSVSALNYNLTSADSIGYRTQCYHKVYSKGVYSIGIRGDEGDPEYNSWAWSAYKKPTKDQLYPVGASYHEYKHATETVSSNDEKHYAPGNILCLVMFYSESLKSYIQTNQFPGIYAIGGENMTDDNFVTSATEGYPGHIAVNKKVTFDASFLSGIITEASADLSDAVDQTTDAPDDGGDDDKPDPTNYPWDNSSSGADHWGGGDGDYDYHTDPIDLPEPPQDNPNDVGFVRLWSPNRGQLKEIMKFLWGKTFYATAAQVFGNNDPFETVLSLKEYPFKIDASETAPVVFGTVNSKVQCNIAPSNYYKIQYKGMGLHPSNTFMDFTPMSSVELYLPFVGNVPLDMDAITGHTVTVQYLVDIVSGQANVSVHVGTKVMYTYNAIIGKDLPITATDYQRSAQSWMQFAIAALGTTTLIAAPAMIAGTKLTAAAALGAGVGVYHEGEEAANTKQSVKSSGSLGGSPGYMGVKYPYFIYKMTNFAGAKLKGLTGSMSESVLKLSSLKGTGYCECDATHIHIEGATAEELDYIKNALESGCYL